MIGKDCEKPLKLLMLEALNRRLPESHPVQAALTVDIRKIHAGYRGEKRVFSILKALPEKDYLLFHDLRLPSIPYPFQIDILLVSSSFILILEVKNIMSNLKNGVFCPECFYHSMKRKNGVWACYNCSFKSKDAHLAALIEYALLIKPTITNQELRRFLQIPSPSTANKLIASMNLSYTGETKGRVYNLHHGRNSFLRG